MRLVPINDDFKRDEEKASCLDDDIMYVDGGFHMAHDNDMCHTIYLVDRRNICGKSNENLSRLRYPRM